MALSCRLVDACLDCPNSHFDIHNEIVRPNGSLTPTTVKSTIFCRHMAVCPKYVNHNQGDQIILVPLASYIDQEFGSSDDSDDIRFNTLNIDEGDGINE